MNKANRRIFTADFKAKAVHEASLPCVTAKIIAEKYGVSEVQLSQWKNELQKGRKQHSFRFPKEVCDALTSLAVSNGNLTDFVTMCVRRQLSVMNRESNVMFVTESHDVMTEITHRFLEVTSDIGVLDVKLLPDGYLVTFAGAIKDLPGFTDLLNKIVTKNCKQISFALGTHL